MQLAIFTMGGTIDKVYFDDLSDYTVGEPQIGAILAGSNVDFDYEVVEVARKDSLYVTDAEREVLRARIAADPRHCVLVTHGTDTMTETARVLATNPATKTIVLTAFHARPPGFRSVSDATFNVAFCAWLGARPSPPPAGLHRHERPGVPGRTVRKNPRARRVFKT